MKNFFREHTNSTLVFLGILFLALIVSYFAWGIGYIVMEINRANTVTPVPLQGSGFDLKAAGSLDYRGLMQP